MSHLSTLAVSRPKLESLMEAARDDRARYLGQWTSRFSAPMGRPLLQWAGVGAAVCLGFAGLA